MSIKNSLCKNGRTNTNKVRKGYTGIKGWRYHPTKGYRKDKDFRLEVIPTTPLEGMIVHPKET